MDAAAQLSAAISPLRQPLQPAIDISPAAYAALCVDTLIIMPLRAAAMPTPATIVTPYMRRERVYADAYAMLSAMTRFCRHMLPRAKREKIYAVL